MIELQPSNRRGHTRTHWLESRHTFSFGDYHDPEHMGFRSLRVINEDHIAPGAGFPEHPHRNMEILTWVLEGSLAHRDSTGGREVLRPGEIQRMSAGRGIRHSEMNASEEKSVHLLQIWILPEEKGLEPGYEQRPTPVHEKRGRLHRIAAPEGGVVSIHQDAELWIGALDEGAEVHREIGEGRHGWLQVARGSLAVRTDGGDDLNLAQGDGAAVTGEPTLTIHAPEPAEVLFFDLA